MIPFSPPHIDQSVIDEVVDTLRSGWITTGPKTKLFEKKLTEYCGHHATLCVNSATAGLELMLRWFGVKEGDEVIIPAYTYSATANVVVHCGARPVFVDSGTDFLVSPERIREAISGKTKVIMPVDFGGMPCDYDAIAGIVDNPQIVKLFRPEGVNQEKLGKILVLSDAAHSFGAMYKGKRTGSLAPCSVFSFHAVKNLTTAEGGAVALNFPPPFDNQAIYSQLVVSSLHGQNKDAMAKLQKGNWKYDIVEAGHKMNMTDIQAAMGLAALRRYDSEDIPRRRQICERYLKAFSSRPWAIAPPMVTETYTGSFHLYPLLVDGISEAQRDEIIRRIFDRDVAVNVHFIPVPMMTFYSNRGYDVKNYPVALDLFSREISLPVYYDLSDEQVDTVIEAVIQSVEETINTKL